MSTKCLLFGFTKGTKIMEVTKVFLPQQHLSTEDAKEFILWNIASEGEAKYLMN